MSMKYIGKTIDIHGGGQDLVFPHHENEIAQSEALTGELFSRFWLHNGFVTINREKMSKSLNNFFSMEDIFGDYSPQAVRYFLLSQHYRSPIDFSRNALDDAEKTVERINRIYESPTTGTASSIQKDLAEEELDKFLNALSDDFNTSAAFSHFFALIKLFNQTKDRQVMEKIEETDRILNFLHLEKRHKGLPVPEEEILLKIEQRQQARKQKNYELADSIRTGLEKKGILLEDSPEGIKWRIK